VNASTRKGISYEELEEKKLYSRVDLGAGGSLVEWKTNNGVVQEAILKTGLHDAIVVMGYPVFTMAMMRSFEAADSSFTC
jgi:abhydrolase domain-containing protein 12